MSPQLLDYLASLLTRLHAGAEGNERQLWLARLVQESMTEKEEKLCHMLELLSEVEYAEHKRTFWLTVVEKTSPIAVLNLSMTGVLNHAS